MQEELRFKTFGLPKANPLERSVMFLLYAIIFGGSFIFIFAQNVLGAIACLFIGAFGTILFNYSTNGKFTIDEEKLQKNSYIGFSENGVSIGFNKDDREFRKWNNLKKIRINIHSFKGMIDDDDSENISEMDGIENNNISFEHFSDYKKVNFYIENEESFNDLISFLKNNIIPKLYKLKNIRDESIVIKKLEYNELQEFKKKYDINRYTDIIYFN